MKGPIHTDKQGRKFYRLTEIICDNCKHTREEVGGPWTTWDGKHFCPVCWQYKSDEENLHTGHCESCTTWATLNNDNFCLSCVNTFSQDAEGASWGKGLKEKT